MSTRTIEQVRTEINSVKALAYNAAQMRRANQYGRLERQLDALYREEDAIRKAENGDWFPACGGTEKPFQTRTGRTLLYCWQPASGRHAYLDVGTDLILTDDEARLALAI